MAAFQYQALDRAGKTKKGILSADSVRVARKELQALGLTPLSLEAVQATEKKQGGKVQRFSANDLVLVTRQLATLVNASTPVEEALNAVAAQMNKPAIRSVLLTVRGRVIEGWRLSDALGEHPKVFGELYRGIVSSGETSGELGSVLTRLAEMLEKNRATMMKALTSLIYPAVLGIIALIVITGLMVFVVPKIVEQFDTMGAELPFITKFVIGVSSFLQNWGLGLLVFILVAGLGFWRGMKIPSFRLKVDSFIVKLPVMGKMLAGMDAARFARTLSTLFAAGVPLLECLQAGRKTVVNKLLHKQLGESLTAVSEGSSLAVGLRKANILPPMLGYMIAAGERSGDLPLMLDKTAEQMETEFDAATTLALRLIEPLIIVGMGGVVMVIVLAILYPVMQINTLTIG